MKCKIKKKKIVGGSDERTTKTQFSTQQEPIQGTISKAILRLTKF